MVDVVIGYMFASKAQTLVNTVNCVGVMGKGIALGFRTRFPEMYADYVKRCNAGSVKLGKPYLYKRLIRPWILNFPTKDHWRSVSRLADIVAGLEYLESHYREWGVTSLAVPPLGCGEGQLEWRVVGRTLYRHLKRLDIPVELYAPYGTPKVQLQPQFLEQSEANGQQLEGVDQKKMDPAWVALVDILARIEAEPHHWPIGRVGFQKIAYFATESGIPTKLSYRRGSFGPYAPDLKRLVTRLVNNGLIQEERLGRMLAIKVGPTFRDARREYRHDLDRWHETIEKVTDLFVRIRTTQQSELASTVHFAALSLSERSNAKPSEEEVVEEVLNWKRRRNPQPSAEEVALATRNLAILRWLELESSSCLPIKDDPALEA